MNLEFYGAYVSCSRCSVVALFPAHGVSYLALIPLSPLAPFLSYFLYILHVPPPSSPAGPQGRSKRGPHQACGCIACPWLGAHAVWRARCCRGFVLAPSFSSFLPSNLRLRRRCMADIGGYHRNDCGLLFTLFPLASSLLCSLLADGEPVS